MKKALLIILIILVILIGAPLCYLFLSGGNYDASSVFTDPEILSPSERYSIDADSRTLHTRFSEGDLIYVLNTEAGGDIFTLSENYLSAYGITLQKAGMDLKDGKLYLDARFIFKGFLPLPVRIIASVNTDGPDFSCIPETVYLGKWIHLSVSRLPLPIDDLTYDICEMHPFFEGSTAVAVAEHGIEVTMPYPLAWLMDGMESFPSDYTMIIDLVDPGELDTLLPQFIGYTDGNAEIAAKMMDSFSSDPAAFIEIKKYSMALGTAHASSDFFNGTGNEYNKMLFPELTKDSVSGLKEEMLASYMAIYDERADTLSAAFQYLLDGYASGNIVVKNKKLVYKEKGDPEVLPATIPALEGTDDWFDIGTARCILAENGGDYTLRQVPKGDTITSFIFRTHTQRPVIAYRYTETLFKIRSLTEEEYTAMMTSENVPTYDLGEHTTKRK